MSIGYISNSYLWLFSCAVLKRTSGPTARGEAFHKSHVHGADTRWPARNCVELTLEGQRHLEMQKLKQMPPGTERGTGPQVRCGRPTGVLRATRCWWGFLLGKRSGLRLVREKNWWRFYLFTLVFDFFLPKISIGGIWEEKNTKRFSFWKYDIFFSGIWQINHRFQVNLLQE